MEELEFLIISCVRKILEIDSQSLSCSSGFLSTRNSSAPTGQIFVKFDTWMFFFFFKKPVEKIQVLLKWEKNEYFTWKPVFVYDNILAEFFLKWEIFQTDVVEKKSKRVLCLRNLFPKLWCLWDNGGKYGRAIQRTDDGIMQHVHTACWGLQTHSNDG